MVANDSGQTAVEQADGQSTVDDPYQKICRAMTPGLLITVNDSDPTTTGIDELTVIRVDGAGDVHLRAHTGEQFVLTHNDPDTDGPVIKEVSEAEFSPIHDTVTTIEIVGIGSVEEGM